MLNENPPRCGPSSIQHCSFNIQHFPLAAHGAPFGAYNRSEPAYRARGSPGVGVTSEIGDFLNYLTYERNSSINTVSAYRDDLESFVGFLSNDYLSMARDQLELGRIDQVTIRAYLAHLARRKLGRASIARHL